MDLESFSTEIRIFWKTYNNTNKMEVLEGCSFFFLHPVLATQALWVLSYNSGVDLRVFLSHLILHASLGLPNSLYKTALVSKSLCIVA